MKYFVDKLNLNLMLKLVIAIIFGFLISRINFLVGLLIALLSVGFFIFQYIENREVRVHALQQYLKDLNQGIYSLDISEYQEGELAKLQAELYKTTIMIKNMNIQLKDQKDTLQQALEDIAHQLKTPLSSLLLLNELQEPDELVHRSSEQIGRLTYLVESLLALIKLDANLDEFEMDKHSIQDIIDPVTTLIQPQLGTLCLEMDVHNEICFCDLRKTQEVLLNILNNKTRYAHSKIIIKSKQDSFSTYIMVSDDRPPHHTGIF